ncbi:MAG: hypothetical protein MRY74_11140 [Neomegalonema sp.]|nr:hypothetical protein [Neomegalonema sp.]
MLTFGKAWTEEAFHDSFYYLGFMFTLVALAVSVYQIAGKPAGERAEQLGPIMVENSVAVASTVVGLLLRNFLAMLSRPSIGRRDRDKFEIVMAQLTKLVDTFPDANDGFAALSHRMETLPEQCNRVAEALSELESQVAAAALSIHSSPVAADEFWNTIESGFKTTREEVDHFQASVGDLNDAILQTTREASGIGASTTTVFSEISERMQSQFEALDEELARAPERVKQLLKDAIDRRVDAAAEGDASQKLREIQQGFASYLQHLQDMNDDLRTATSEMRQTWVDHAGVVEIASHNASESVQKFATAETAVRESLEALARELRAISRSAR